MTTYTDTNKTVYCKVCGNITEGDAADRHFGEWCYCTAADKIHHKQVEELMSKVDELMTEAEDRELELEEHTLYIQNKYNDLACVVMLTCVSLGTLLYLGVFKIVL